MEAQQSPEEKFIQRLPAKTADVVKMLKKLEDRNLKFTAEQRKKIEAKYKNDLKNPYSKNGKELKELLEKFTQNP